MRQLNAIPEKKKKKLKHFYSMLRLNAIQEKKEYEGFSQRIGFAVDLLLGSLVVIFGCNFWITIS